MLYPGADIRFVEEMLGHRRLETTQLYTHGSSEQLMAVHRTKHPAELDWSADDPAAPPPTALAGLNIAPLRLARDLVFAPSAERWEFCTGHCGPLKLTRVMQCI